MLVTFALLIAAGAVSPAVWFTWWLLADAAESRRHRRPAGIVALSRGARTHAAGAARYQRAA